MSVAKQRNMVRNHEIRFRSSRPMNYGKGLVCYGFDLEPRIFAKLLEMVTLQETDFTTVLTGMIKDRYKEVSLGQNSNNNGQ